MYKVIKTAIKEKKLIILLCIGIVIYGLYSYYIIPKQENPDATSPAGMITTIFPGASSEDIEKLVTKKIEDEAATLEGIEKIESVSNNSVSVVIVTLNYKVDKQKQWDELRNRLTTIKGQLPEQCREPVLNTDLINTAQMIVSLSGENYSYEQLGDFAKEFKEELVMVDGVKRFEIDGKVNKEINVDIDIGKLNQFSLSVEDIYNLLKMQNLEIPSGSIKTETGKINVKVLGTFESIRDIENLIIDISPDTGAVVRLKDIAKIHMGLEQDTKIFKQDGKNAVLLTGYFEDNRNVVLIGKNIRKKLEQLKNKYPKDLKINKVLFQPQNVNKSVNNFIMNLLQGIFFVLIVVLIGMGIRNALIVATTIPLSIFITFIVMNVTGIQIQQMSIAALIIALGILVDNSIVISDAIQVKINNGKPRFTSAYEGTKESAVPVLTSTLTTLAAFAPLTTLPGEAGEFTKTLPQVVMIALIASYAVAMLVTPTFCSMFLKKTPIKSKKDSKVRLAFEKMLKFGLKYKKTTIIIALTLLISSLGLIFTLNMEIFPYADKDVMYLNINSEKTGDINKTEQLTDKVRKMLLEEKEILTTTTVIGGALPKFYVTNPPVPPSPDFAQMMIKFKLPKGGRFNNKQDFALYLQKKFEDKLIGGSVSVNMLALTNPGPDIDVRVSGKNRQRVNKVARQIKEQMENMKSTINVKDDITDLSFQYIIDVDTDMASNMGLTKYDIQKQINLALHGGEASIFRKAGKEYAIIVKCQVDNIEQLKNLGIKSSITNNKILLKQVADVKLGNQIEMIKRYDREPSTAVTCDIRPGFSNLTEQKYVEKMVNKIDTNDVKISYGGEKEIFTKYLKGLGKAALFAICVIYLILLVQFNSLLQPIIILITVPLSVIGVALGLKIMGLPLTFTVGLGAASLIGIVVNNAILLIEYINRSRKKGGTVHFACIDSVDKRFRPIMLSTTTTVIGLIPLATSGSSFFTPMAVGLMSGLLLSTLLTMIIIPVFYSLFEKEQTVH